MEIFHLKSLSDVIRQDKILSPQILFTLVLLFFLLAGNSGLSTLSLSLFLIFLIPFITPHFIKSKHRSSNHFNFFKLGYPLIFIGIISEIICFWYTGGIPLFYPFLRAKLPLLFTTLAFLIVPGFAIKFTEMLNNDKKKPAGILFLFSLILISFLGYRTEVFALLISAILIYLYLTKDSIKKLKMLLPVASIIILMNFIVVLFRSSSLSEPLIRFSSTLQVFTSLVKSTGFSLFGVSKGALSLSIFSSMSLLPGPNFNPRGLITSVLGANPDVTTTPTILAIPYLDFGILGLVLFGFFLGYIFKIGHNQVKKGNITILPMYSLCFSFLLISIETGIADFIVILYFLVYLILLFR